MIRDFLPEALRIRLWGDRAQWGAVPDLSDPCWLEWKRTSTRFYLSNQRTGIGIRVNDAGYQVMKKIDLKNKTVLEFGPGDIRHIKYWQGNPKQYIIVDVSEEMMSLASKRLEDSGVSYQEILSTPNKRLELKDESVDVIISFFSLEHLYPLRPYLEEMHRLLKPGGIIIGAIPSEGGLAWGLGRYLTTRRWLKKNTSINPDKLICWEHPNYADYIVTQLEQTFSRKLLSVWPIKFFRLYDFGLVVRFIFSKSSDV